LRPFATTLALACASASVLADAIPPDKVPAFAIPRMSKPPTLDGKIDADEWREAVAVSGVVNQAYNLLVPRPTLFFLAWDPGHLYLACRTWVMPGYKPRVGGREPGAANAGDDGLELHFKPMGKNVPTGRTDSSYKFFINCLGFPGETVRVAVGHSDAATQPLADGLEAAVGEAASVIDVVRYRVGPSVGAHTGPGTVGCFVFPA